MFSCAFQPLQRPQQIPHRPPPTSLQPLNHIHPIPTLLHTHTYIAMAPTPADDAAPSPTQSTESKSGGAWSTGTIVVGAVFIFLLVAFLVSVAVFYIRKRKQRNKLPPQNRSSSYRPFRTESTDKSGLLANQAPTPEEDKTSMYSRQRGASVSLYVDTATHDRRASMETVSLIPLHVTPAQEPQDPMAATISNGSGVSGVSSISRGSSRYSTSTGGALNLSPVHESGELGSRPATRPRSTSTTSTRYYSTNSPDNPAPPQIPKIVHTPSQ